MNSSERISPIESSTLQIQVIFRTKKSPQPSQIHKVYVFNMNGNQKIYTFAEIAKHNTYESSWCVVRGKVLDLTNFIKRHPGGSQIILASGIDATVLVDSYHPNGVPSAILDKLTIGAVEKSVSYYEFDDRPEAFYPTLKRRVHNHLAALGVPRRGSKEIQIKATVIFTVLFLTYIMGWIVSDMSLGLRIFFAFLHGVAAAHVGMSVMHDANHAAFSTSSRVNSIFGATLDLIGASGCVWSFQHVVSHHAFTNLETRTQLHLENHRNLKGGSEKKDDMDLQLSHENDVDVFSSFPFIRMHPGDERHWYHRYQQFYAPILFGLLTLAKVFFSDLHFYFSTRVSHVDMTPRMSLWSENFVFLGFKVLNIFFMCILPYYLHGPKVAILLFVVAHFTAGFYLSVCFLVSHISEGALFYRGGQQLGLKGADILNEQDPISTQKVHPRDWAACQAGSTVNWAAESWFWGAFSGGLNTQLEHHLFPGVNHTAYRFMPPIVREVCDEFGVPYVEVPNLFSAIVLCMKYLRDLGIEDNPQSGPSKVIT